MAGMDTGFLNRLVQTFDRTDRTILMLYYVEHVPLEEISQILHLSSDDIAQRLRDIRQRTREALAQYEPAAA